MVTERYCRECYRRLERLPGGDVLYCCPLGVDQEGEIGNLVAFESSNGTQYGAPLPPLDLSNLKKDTRQLLDLLMGKFAGVAWERDLLGQWPASYPAMCAAATPYGFRREGYLVDSGGIAEFRIWVTDLARDAWLAANSDTGKGRRK